MFDSPLFLFMLINPDFLENNKFEVCFKTRISDMLVHTCIAVLEHAAPGRSWLHMSPESPASGFLNSHHPDMPLGETSLGGSLLDEASGSHSL